MSQFWCLVDSHIRELQNRGISKKNSTSTICSKKLMPFYSERYRGLHGDTCFVICLTSRTFAIVADENILGANTHIDAGQVGKKIPLFTRVETVAADKHVIPFLNRNYQTDAFDSWCRHESEIQVQSNQRFFFLVALRFVFTASRLSRSSLMG